MSLGQNIAKLRKNIGMTQEQLAEKCDVSRQAVTKWESGESEPAIAKLVKLSEIFNVSIDEIVKDGEVIATSNDSPELVEVNYSMVSAGFLWMSDTDQYDWDLVMWNKLGVFASLCDVYKTRCIGRDGRVFAKYLVQNTTSEERKKFVGVIKREWTEQALEKYIQGECEIDVAFQNMEEEIKKQRDVLLNQFMKKGKTKEARLFGELEAICDLMSLMDDYNEKKLVELREELCVTISKIDDTGLLGRFLRFIGNEILVAFDKKDMKAIEELNQDFDILQSYVKYKIPSEIVENSSED